MRAAPGQHMSAARSPRRGTRRWWAWVAWVGLAVVVPALPTAVNLASTLSAWSPERHPRWLGDRYLVSEGPPAFAVDPTVLEGRWLEVARGDVADVVRPFLAWVPDAAGGEAAVLVRDVFAEQVYAYDPRVGHVMFPLAGFERRRGERVYVLADASGALEGRR